jgi:hypothetical protein
VQNTGNGQPQGRQDKAERQGGDQENPGAEYLIRRLPQPQGLFQIPALLYQGKTRRVVPLVPP